MDSADTRASEESRDGMPGHGKVDRDCVTLANAKGLEDVGDSAHFTMKLAIGNDAAFVRFVCFPDDGGLERHVGKRVRNKCIGRKPMLITEARRNRLRPGA